MATNMTIKKISIQYEMVYFMVKQGTKLLSRLVFLLFYIICQKPYALIQLPLVLLLYDYPQEVEQLYLISNHP